MQEKKDRKTLQEPASRKTPKAILMSLSAACRNPWVD